MPIVFNGNNYTAEWKEEAAARGLPDVPTTVEALEYYSEPSVKSVFMRHGVLSEREILSRQDILLDNYAKTIAIEASLTSRIGRTSILPVTLKAQTDAAELVRCTREALGGSGGALPEEKLFTALREHNAALEKALDALDKARDDLHTAEETLAHARMARDLVLPAMNLCRKHIDALEIMVSDEKWPLPTYAELLWTR
jgi:glutamine synthetase